MTKTFPQTTSTKSRGFSLIELMVVVAIIGLFTAVALPKLTSFFRVSLESATRDLASIIKETYNATMVTGKVHRLVFDLTKNEYWVESSPNAFLLNTSESREKIERRKRRDRHYEEAPSGFNLERLITRKKKSLPMGVSIEDIVTQQGDEPVTTGTAYSHFFPYGITERTIVHLKDQSEHQFSLVIAPTIGSTDLYMRYVRPNDAFGK